MSGSGVGAGLVEKLVDALGDSRRVSAGSSDRESHGRGLSWHPGSCPDVVVYPVSTAEVVAAIRVAGEQGAPLVAWGAGSGLEGNAIPVAGGIVLDLSRMNRILTLDPAEMLAVVEAGTARLELERAAANHGLRFAVDPGADATLGGMAATNAAGTMTFRYGKMRANTLALEAVLADGQVIRSGVRSPKTSAGYDITGLLVGSEGTLAVITELTLRLVAIPEETQLLLASFEAVGPACEAALVLRAGCAEAMRIELLDGWFVNAVNASSELALSQRPLLMIELAGGPAALAEARATTLAALVGAGATEIREERDPGAQRRAWRARHHAHFAKKQAAPGRASLTTDVCVPASELGAAIGAAHADLRRRQLTGGVVAHAGDGNFHVGLMLDPDDEDEMARTRGFVERLIEDAIGRGGSCTGEHGVGLGKIDALERQHGDLLPTLRAIKRAFDPDGILNPGKVLRPSAS